MELQELLKQLQKADKAYWVDNQPIMSDQAYDQLVERIRVLSPDEPTVNRIGGVKGNVTHNPPMLSLNKVYSHADLVKWVKSVARDECESFLVQLKYDGIAGKLQYTSYQTPTCTKQGYMLSTRGDGNMGENITDKLKHIEILTDKMTLVNICLDNDGVIPPYWACVPTDRGLFMSSKPVYGELVITNDNFDKYFRSEQIRRKDGSPYTTPRNAVAGLINSDDLVLPEHILTFIDYNYISNTLTRDEICDPKVWETIVNNLTRYPYPCDGIVVKLADEQYAESLGSTIHHPRGAMAYKFTNNKERSVIEDIVWECGMRSITPVATLKPIVINDVTITKATLFNMKYVLVNNFCVGDHVTVERAGDVIPHICVDGHVHNGEGCVIPNVCPACGAATIRGDVELICSNPKCCGAIIAKLIKGVKELKIDGFGNSTLDIMVHNGVESMHQLLTLTAADIQSLLNCSDLMANKLAKSLEEAKQSVAPEDLLSAMGIPGVGKAAAKRILEIVDLEHLIQDSIEVLIDKGLTGRAIYDNMLEWLRNQDNRKALGGAYLACVMKKVTSHDTRPTVCFTGAMSAPRREMEKLAIAKGFRPVNVVTKDLTLLVVPDQTYIASSKLDTAKRYNIKTICESRFRNLEV